MNNENIKTVYDIKEEINKLKQENDEKVRTIEYRIYCKLR